MGRLGFGRVIGALALLVSLVSLVWPIAPVHAQTGVPVLVVDGRGFGHGVGLAQDGALSMGRAGASTAGILGQFYPGTSLARDANPGQQVPDVRVIVFDSGPIGPGSSTVVAFPDGGDLRDALFGQQSPGFPIHVAVGGAVRLTWDGARYQADAGQGGRVSTAAAADAAPAPSPLPVVTLPPPTTEPIPSAPSTPSTMATTTTTAAGRATTTTAAPSPGPAPAAPRVAPGTASSTRPLWAVPTGGGQPGEGTTSVAATQRAYRGVVEAIGQQGTLRLVNQLPVEDYLKGMGEVLNPSWPAAALQAQAIAARTYALRAMQSGGELCDDQRCQVYLGAAVEYGAMNAAVAATRGVVVAAGGALADTVYSANGGGFSASREEGFGLDDTGFSYLRPAPYPTVDPAPWEAKVALSDVAARLSGAGTLTQVVVAARGPSGRAVKVALSGSRGTVTASGLAFAEALSLRSTLFTVRVELDGVAPASPPDGSALQQSPDALMTPFITPVSGAHQTRAGLPAGQTGRPGVAWAIVVGLVLAAVVPTLLTSRNARPR